MGICAILSRRTEYNIVKNIGYRVSLLSQSGALVTPMDSAWELENLHHRVSGVGLLYPQMLEVASSQTGD
jgi:hypothetical protein